MPRRGGWVSSNSKCEPEHSPTVHQHQHQRSVIAPTPAPMPYQCTIPIIADAQYSKSAPSLLFTIIIYGYSHSEYRVCASATLSLSTIRKDSFSFSSFPRCTPYCLQCLMPMSLITPFPPQFPHHPITTSTCRVVTCEKTRLHNFSQPPYICICTVHSLTHMSLLTPTPHSPQFHLSPPRSDVPITTSTW